MFRTSLTRIHLHRADRRDGGDDDPRVGGAAARARLDSPAARSRAQGGPARHARGDRQVQGLRGTGRIAATELQFGSENYPTSLEQLVDGVTLANDATGRKKKFLRRIPIDPMTGLDRLGPARLPGHARRDGLGRAERLRRLLEGRRQGDSTARSTGTGERNENQLELAAAGGRGGWTLIELLVVISLIMILASLALTSVSQLDHAREGSRAASRTCS